MNNPEREAMLAEIIEMTAPKPRPPGSVTAREYQEAHGCSDNSARRWLAEAVKADLLDSGIRYDPDIGQRVRCWWKAGTEVAEAYEAYQRGELDTRSYDEFRAEALE